MLAPSVICIATLPASEQIVRANFDAPRAWKNRRSMLDPWIMPIVPAYE